MEKKKIIISIVSVLLVGALIFGVYWKATEYDRFLKSEMEDVQEQVDDYRSGEIDSFHIFFLEEVAKDPKMEELLLLIVKEMCENEEFYMLNDFLGELEYTDLCSENILNAINEYIGSVKLNDMEDYESLEVSAGSISGYLEYYKVKAPSLNRDTGFLAEYINKNGTKAFTSTVGKGFYADKKNESSTEVVGLSNSPLHNSKTIIYEGDFKYVRSYGVRLNRYYEETSYSDYTYYFRDNMISFKSDAGELVWSGEYLFCFSPNGTLLDYATISE